MFKGNATKVRTGYDTRWSYVNVWEPKAPFEGAKAKYSVCLLIPKTDTEVVEDIKASIKAAYKEGESVLKGNGKSVPDLKDIAYPLYDGDVKRPDDPAYAGHYYLNAKSDTAPQIVDANKERITEKEDVYSGVYGRATITFYPFNKNGQKGIACGLNNLQKIRDGEPLGFKTSAAEDFGDPEKDDFLD